MKILTKRNISTKNFMITPTETIIPLVLYVYMILTFHTFELIYCSFKDSIVPAQFYLTLDILWIGSIKKKIPVLIHKKLYIPNEIQRKKNQPTLS